MVQYKNLVEENDQTRPLVNIVSADETRPLLRLTTPKESTRTFQYLERVDAFNNDSWWVGTITEKRELKNWVYFETTRDEIACPVSRLRNNLEWRMASRFLATKVSMDDLWIQGFVSFKFCLNMSKFDVIFLLMAFSFYICSTSIFPFLISFAYFIFKYWKLQPRIQVQKIESQKDPTFKSINVLVCTRKP
ncbi:hypothetical protein V6N13_132807 [Hibiscus sabdariffa]|uniref:Agenet domain-containing protein n=1 Tax=Hibiscus sabdariffa TaxID=183260 RepID=A0ABR2PWC3_9ROSI